MDVSEVLDDLVAEQQALDDVVASLTPEKWQLATPSPGWTIADQIGHLTYFDGTAALAITDPTASPRLRRIDQRVTSASESNTEGVDPPDAVTPSARRPTNNTPPAGFAEEMNRLLGAGTTGESADDITLAPYRAMAADELLAAWRANRSALDAAGATLDNDTRVAWYGPSMGAKSFLTARLMEAWAHGQDIVDALDDGADRPPTDRLRHISQLGVITRGWTYVNRGLEVPSAAVRIELTSPSGASWTFGDEGAPESIVGPALDFCLVTTQRRHVDDTDLVVTGAAARDWMKKAQLFAGPPSDGPAPRPTEPEERGPR